MHTSKHVCNTWLLGLHLFSFLLLVDYLLHGNSLDGKLLVPLYFYSAIFSLPALLVALLLFTPVLKTGLPLLAQLVLWILVVCVGIILSALIFCILFSDVNLMYKLTDILVIAIAAAILSILLRLPQFLHFITIKTKTYEKDLA